MTVISDVKFVSLGELRCRLLFPMVQRLRGSRNSASDVASDEQEDWVSAQEEVEQRLDENIQMNVDYINPMHFLFASSLDASNNPVFNSERPSRKPDTATGLSLQPSL